MSAIRSTAAVAPGRAWFHRVWDTLGVLLAFAVLAGCQLLPDQGRSLQAETQSVVVLFQDDFSSPASGWQSLNEPGAQAHYVEGAFRFQVSEPERYFWSTPGLDFRDAQLRVFVTKLAGLDTGTFGAICRYQNAENFYFFTITADGFYAVGKFEDGVESLLGMDRMQSGPAIMRGAVTNHLTVSCVGQTLSLEVNGAELIKVSDPSFPSGDIGLIAAALTVGDLDIQFENLSITTP